MQQLVYITQQALLLTLVISAPAVLISLTLGLIVAVIQATTQIQEQTLSFAPKLFAVVAVLALGGSWMGHQLWAFAFKIFDRFPSMIAR